MAEGAQPDSPRRRLFKRPRSSDCCSKSGFMLGFNRLKKKRTRAIGLGFRFRQLKTNSVRWLLIWTQKPVHVNVQLQILLSNLNGLAIWRSCFPPLCENKMSIDMMYCWTRFQRWL